MPDVQNQMESHHLRYAQCWEDADLLVDALDIQEGDVCLSIASGGDNSLAMLSRAPSRVIALDFNPVQIALLELKVAAFRVLEYQEVLELMGSRKSNRRIELYKSCRNQLAGSSRRYWDYNSKLIARGIGGAGRFEQYLRLFRKLVLPLAHGRNNVEHWFKCSSREELEEYYHGVWDTRSWRILFRLFFSRFVMGQLGRDPQFFKHAEGEVSARILARTRDGLMRTLPADNPYLQWILTGNHSLSLPYALRRSNFESIRDNLDRLEWHCISLERYLETADQNSIKHFNLSNVFEYIPEDKCHHILELLINAGQQNGRLAYWNMLVPRKSPEYLRKHLLPLNETVDRLVKINKVFFYSDFILEELC